MKEREVNGEARVLCWPGRLLSEDDLRRHLTCQHEILLTPKTIVTPLALDHLRGKGVRVRRETVPSTTTSNNAGGWGYAQEMTDALVTAMLTALAREGVALARLRGSSPLEWARAIAGKSNTEDFAGGLVFCGDPGLVCCIANKVGGVRAVAVVSAAQAKRARQTVGANLIAVEMPGRTFHELRQIVRTALSTAPGALDLVKNLQELDRHAHR